MSDNAFSRIKEVTGCRTQVQLAEMLGIRQSSISDANRRGSVPADWLITLFRKLAVNPEWILSGTGPKYLSPDASGGKNDGSGNESPSARSAQDRIREQADALRRILASLPVAILEEELARRGPRR